jgi:predicted transcriptional regulator
MSALKVHRNFKIEQSINNKLVKEAAKTKRTQTAIVELALAEWFKVKRGQP